MTETCAQRHHVPPPWPIVFLAIACLLIATATRAQVVHVANYSGAEFDGWKRATVDVMPPTKAGQAGDVLYVLGRHVGSDARTVDLRLRLAPGEVRSIDLRKADPAQFDLAALPADPLAFFGLPSIAGVPFSIVDAKPDGAAWLAHLRARTGPMLCVDLWVTWYPDQPSWATAEVVVTASNPTVPDLVATVPEDFRLRFGAADVVVPGLPMAPRLGMTDRRGDGSELLGREIRDAVLGQPSPIRPERLDDASDGRSDVATGLDDLASGNPSVSERHSARATIAQAVDDGAPVRMLPHADARLLIGLALMPGAAGPVGGLGDDRPVGLDDADRGATGESDGAGFGGWIAHGSRWVAVSQVASLIAETAAVPVVSAMRSPGQSAVVAARGAVSAPLVFLDRAAGAASPGPAHSATASAALRREGALRGEALRDRAEVDAVAGPQDGRDVLGLARPVPLDDGDLLVSRRGRAGHAEAPGAIAELGVGGRGSGAGDLAGHRSGLGLGAPWPGGAGRERSLATGGSRPDSAGYVNHLAYISRDEQEAIRTTGLRATDFFGTGRIGDDSGGARPSNRGAEAGHLSTGVRRSPAGGASAAVDRAGAGRDDRLAAGDGGGAVLLPAGTVIGDGQARSFPLVFIWRQHLTSEREWSSAGAAASLSICANGIAKLWPDGNPAPVSDPLGWARRNWAGAIARLHAWDAGPLGVKARSGDTGAQEDQVFIGGECIGPASLGAETVRYLVALGQSRRPCHHLEAGGALLDLAKHPKLVIWSGRAHWHTGVSSDQLGKPRALTEIESHGWSGPDREHWLQNTVAIAYRLTGSPALQWQLEAQARLFLLQETVDPKLSTSDFSAERAIGWAGIVAVHLWRSLEDRTLAEQVAQRWRDRVVRVYIPKLGGKAQDVWYPRNDARLIADTGWSPLNFMPYQQAIGAYGLDYACRWLGPAEGRALALRGAKAALRAWERLPDGRWKPWSYWGYSSDLTAPFIEGRGAHDGANVWVWFTPAVWMVRDREPQNEQARMIWQQVARETDPKWVPVESVR